jgi:DNA-binding response OmpR family regulator
MISAHHEVERLLDQIRERVKGDPVVERASNQIEVLCRGYMAPDPLENVPSWIKADLTGKETAFLSLLVQREGHVVSKSALMDAVYAGQPDEPLPKIADVFICKLRKKLANTNYVIETAWGLGYRLIKANAENPISPGQLAKRAKQENRDMALRTADRMMAA